MRLTNMLERYNQEIKRWTRVVRIFPNEQSCIRLVSALAIETNEEWMALRYLRINRAEVRTQSTTDDLAAYKNCYKGVSKSVRAKSPKYKRQ